MSAEHFIKPSPTQRLIGLLTYWFWLIVGAPIGVSWWYAGGWRRKVYAKVAAHKWGNWERWEGRL